MDFVVIGLGLSALALLTGPDPALHGCAALVSQVPRGTPGGCGVRPRRGRSTPCSWPGLPSVWARCSC